MSKEPDEREVPSYELPITQRDWFEFLLTVRRALNVVVRWIEKKTGLNQQNK
jgi:hypothetical protein